MRRRSFAKSPFIPTTTNPAGNGGAIFIEDIASMARITISDVGEHAGPASADDLIPAMRGDARGSITPAKIKQYLDPSYATAAQGEKADNAAPLDREIATGTGLTGGGDLSENREISLSAESIASLDLANSSIQPHDIGTAASKDESAFATAAQGLLADTAVQPADLGTAAVANLLDENDMVSNSDTDVPSQRSVKNYVDVTAAAAAEGIVAKATWAELSGITGSNYAGRVTGPDDTDYDSGGAGTHTDPVTSETVANVGEYVWDSVEEGWRWVSNENIQQMKVDLYQEIDDRTELITEVTDDTDKTLTEVHDELGNIMVRVSTEEAMVAGLTIVPDNREPVEYQDWLENVYARFDPTESMINGVYFRPEGEGIEIHDYLGYIQMREGTVSGGSSDPDETPSSTQPTSTVPLFGGVIWGVDGETTPLYLDNLLADRNDPALCQASFFSKANLPPIVFDRQADIDVGGIGGAGTLIVRPRIWDGTGASELRLTARAAANPGAGQTIKILAITDSIATYQGLYLVSQWLDEWNYIAAFDGTLRSQGATAGSYSFDYMGECRPGIELRDYTNLLTSTMSPVAIGDEAAFLELDTSGRRAFNPLLVPEDNSTWGGPYDPEDVRNGHAIDFDAYPDRFGVVVPDVLWMPLLTNDINALPAGEIYDTVYSELWLMWRRWRAHSATKPFLFDLIGTARTAARDLVWKNKYVPAIRAILKLQADLEDANFHFVQSYAHVPNDGGYNKTLTSSTPDPITGVITRTIEDGLHPGSDENPQLDTLRKFTFRTSAAAIAWAATNIAT